MKMPLKAVGVGMLMSVSIAGFIFWRHGQAPKKAMHSVIIHDNSGSTADDPDAVIGLAERVLNQPKVTRGTTLTIMGVGDERNGNEPTFIAKYDVPYSRRALEGKGKVPRQKSDIRSDLTSRLEKLSRTNHSPIFIAVKRAVEQLRAYGCSSDSDCSVFIRTDGEETIERSIKAAIDSGSRKKILPTISNDGIRIVFCLAQTNAGMSSDVYKGQKVKDAGRSDRLREVWQAIFNMPSLVTFEPYCARQEFVQR